jgi:hypothetical protein
MKDLTQLQNNLDRLNGIATTILRPKFTDQLDKCPKCHKEVSGEEKYFTRSTHMCFSCERSN